MNEIKLEGFDFEYLISRSGVITKILPNGKTRGKEVSIYMKNNTECANLIMNGKPTALKLDNLHAQAFGSGFKPKHREVFKDITDFEDLYSVSNQGRVYKKEGYNSRGHFQKGRFLKYTLNNKGYLTASLICSSGTSTFSVGTLVGRAFLGLDLNMRVFYKTSDRTNNNITNLISRKHGK